MVRLRMCVVWVTLPLLGQNAGAPVFRSEARLVEATAVVRDRDGRVVPD